MTGRALFATWMGLGLLQGSSSMAAEDFAVQLERRAVVGERHLVTGTLRSELTCEVVGDADRSCGREAATVHFELAIETLEVGSQGNGRRAVLTVHRFTREADGVTSELYGPGATIDARIEGGKQVFAVGAIAVAGDAAEALQAAVSLRGDERPTEDEMMGSRQRRRPGETWPMNADAVVRRLDGIPLDPKSVVGRMTLVAKKEVRHIGCLEYSYELEAHTQPSRGEQPLTASKFEIDTIVLSGRRLTPLDPLLPQLSEDAVIKMYPRWQGAAKDAAAAPKFRIRVEMEVHLETSPLPVAAH